MNKTLDNFIRLPSNESAFDYLIAFCKKTKLQANLLVLSGPDGCGKKHLAKGLHMYFVSQNPKITCQCISWDYLITKYRRTEYLVSKPFIEPIAELEEQIDKLELEKLEDVSDPKEQIRIDKLLKLRERLKIQKTKLDNLLNKSFDEIDSRFNSNQVLIITDYNGFNDLKMLLKSRIISFLKDFLLQHTIIFTQSSDQTQGKVETIINEHGFSDIYLESIVIKQPDEKDFTTFTRSFIETTGLQVESEAINCISTYSYKSIRQLKEFIIRLKVHSKLNRLDGLSAKHINSLLNEYYKR